MMKEKTRELLASLKPSERSEAIDRLRIELGPDDLPALRAAMHNESVAALRRQLRSLVRVLERPSPGVAEPQTAVDIDAFQNDVVHWVRHELEPAIALLQFAARDEIDDYFTSQTRAAVDEIRRRLESVEALIRLSAPPRIERVSISEAIDAAVAGSGISWHDVRTVSEDESNDIIESDPRFLHAILSNAIRNASEAISGLSDPTIVHVDSRVSGTSFWIRVSNRFAGTDFAFDEISGTGVTGKIGHRGQGASIMRIAAERLGLDLSMQAEAGIAVFTLRGSRIAQT